MARSPLCRRIIGLLAALGVVVVQLGARSTEPTDAAWVDSETTASTFVAGELESPAATGQCTVSILGGWLSFSWTPPAGGLSPTGYQYRVAWTAGIAVLPNWQESDWVDLNSDQLQFQYRPAGLLRAGAYHVEVRATRQPWSGPAVSGYAHLVSVAGLLGLGTCSWDN